MKTEKAERSQCGSLATARRYADPKRTNKYSRPERICRHASGGGDTVFDNLRISSSERTQFHQPGRARWFVSTGRDFVPERNRSND